MASPMPGNLYEVGARRAKAEALANEIETYAADTGLPVDGLPEAAARLPRQVWLDLAELAGVKTPSDQTIGWVVDILRARRKARAEMPDDPFGGL